MIGLNFIFVLANMSVLPKLGQDNVVGSDLPSTESWNKENKELHFDARQHYEYVQ